VLISWWLTYRVYRDERALYVADQHAAGARLSEIAVSLGLPAPHIGTVYP